MTAMSLLNLTPENLDLLGAQPEDLSTLYLLHMVEPHFWGSI